MAKKKSKRRLKVWVKVVLWCCTLVIGAWILWWPISTLKDYWNKGGDACGYRTEGEEAKSDALVCVSADSLMQVKLARFVAQPTRLDTSDIALSVWDLSAQTNVFQWHDQELMVPASSLKLLTAISAMKRLGTEHCYRERVMITGDVSGGVLEGDAIFQADDNPMVESLDEYVAALKRAGIREIRGRMVLNLMRPDTLRAHHTASFWDIPYNRTPILLKGAPRVVQEMRMMLRNAGIESPRPVVEEGVRIYAAKKILLDKTTKMRDVIAPMLIHSSNIKADALHYHILNYQNRYTGSIGQRECHVDVFLRENLGYDTSRFTLNDGSGLSPENMVSADFLLELLKYAWNEPEIKDVLINEALATPGHPTRRGSLVSRMRSPLYQDRIFCKTGTLTSIGASSLCGYAHGRNGHWYAFAIINRDSPVEESRLYQDLLCKVLVK
ncbi:MAG: D-alanyl-D-alanine carboxypeptidase [Bacteroidaceae bacterium]|nr:D-alanyl-D-alanine carboxypeptidase [Bacteroidaceae bacterium]